MVEVAIVMGDETVQSEPKSHCSSPSKNAVTGGEDRQSAVRSMVHTG